jgi:hypothetical protein
MTRTRSPWKNAKLIIHVVVFSTIQVVAGFWLTVYLIGTLGMKKAPEDSIRESGNFESIIALTEKNVDRYLGEWEFSEPHLPGHFHHIGRWYEPDRWNFCIHCHGPIPHSRKPQLRAFLNMHNLFMSCQVCHSLQRDQDAPARFGWVGISDGRLTSNPEMKEGIWGEYGAKIVQLEGPADQPRPFILAEEEAFAVEFRSRLGELNSGQKVLGNKFIHKRCVENPLSCRECHNSEKPLLPLGTLGYSPKRVDFLLSAEVAHLVQRYEEFHLPNLLKPSSREQGKKEEKD